MLIVFTTVPNLDEAQFLAEKAVKSRLAACVQILPQMSSVYVWEGKVRKEDELLLLIKTSAENYEELEALIIANHSYETPEIAAVNPERVSASYQKWLSEVLI